MRSCRGAGACWEARVTDRYAELRHLHWTRGPHGKGIGRGPHRLQEVLTILKVETRQANHCTLCSDSPMDNVNRLR